MGATEYTTHVSTKIVPQRPKDPSEWVAELGSAINCTDYLGGGVANDAYLNLEDFTKLGMTVSIQDYSMPEYKVGNLKTTEGKEPLLNKNSYISILDPIFKVGKQETLQIIKGISKG